MVRSFAGHGIGSKLHEPPWIPNYGLPSRGPRLLPGMVFAIEPMVNVGAPDVRMLEDEWTAVTADGSLSAHFEHTVLITEEGPDVLTRVPGSHCSHRADPRPGSPIRGPGQTSGPAASRGPVPGSLSTLQPSSQVVEKITNFCLPCVRLRSHPQPWSAASGCASARSAGSPSSPGSVV